MVGIGRTPPPVGPERGDIYFIDFAEIGGRVIRGPHPAVVVQTGRLRRSGTTIIAAMTSSPRSAEFDPPYLVAATARETGLDRDGWVKCDQLATYPAESLGPRAGRLAPEAITRLDAALRFVLGL